MARRQRGEKIWRSARGVALSCFHRKIDMAPLWCGASMRAHRENARAAARIVRFGGGRASMKNGARMVWRLFLFTCTLSKPCICG